MTWAALRRILLFVGLAALSACAGQHQVDNRVEAQHYAAVARGHYAPPGTPDDPWGPYVVEASARYDVPQSWIRNVMRVESGGHEYAADGTLITSAPGAMGLMQVMPETYDELRGRYALGDDPFDPHNNILAGTAYLREMYDLYGSPGFLAAYNAGPARLDKYLAGSAPLPDETRRYVAMIGPSITGDLPVSRSPSDQLALNQLPMNIPGGLRYGHSYAVASRHRGRGDANRAYAANGATSRHGMVRYAVAASAPSVTRVSYGVPASSDQHLQFAYASPRNAHGFHLISSASAEVLPIRRGSGGSGGWAIQVGAFANQGQAREAAERARSAAGGHTAIGMLHQSRGTLYRARLTGLSREAAVSACERMHRGGCMVLAPDAQS
jgi:hypothetical protein